MSGIFPKLDSQNGLRRLWGGPNFRWNLFLLALLPLVMVSCGDDDDDDLDE